MTGQPAPAPAIVFRADAGHKIGFGHVARLVALIDELAASGGEPIVLFGGAVGGAVGGTFGDDDEVTRWLAARGIAARAGAWTTDDVVTLARSHRAHAVVVDGSMLAHDLIPALVDRGIRSVVIDDLGHCALPADVIVNHNYHAPSLASTYRCPHQLLGRPYLMLRRSLCARGRGVCLARPVTRGRLRVVVSFGGSDPIGATARTLRLLPGELALHVIAIAGPGFRDLPALDAATAAARAAGHAVELVHAPDEPGALFATADAAICSAGGTLGELAYLGCPAFACAIAPDQIATARAQADDGLIACGDVLPSLSDPALQAALLRFLTDHAGRRDRAARALATVDGHGSRRILDAIVQT